MLHLLHFSRFIAALTLFLWVSDLSVFPCFPLASTPFIGCVFRAVRVRFVRFRMMVPGGRFIETNIILPLVADGGRRVPGAKLPPKL